MRQFGTRPQGCFSGTPTTTVQYLNACTTAQYMPFDNCIRLGFAAPPLLPDPVASSECRGTHGNHQCRGAAYCEVRGCRPQRDLHDWDIRLRALAQAGYPAARGQYAALSPRIHGRDLVRRRGSVFDPTLTLIKDVPGTATKAANYAYYFDDTGTQVSCSLDPAGNVVDIGVSNLYSTVCNANYLPSATVAGYQGPVVTFGFTVPAVSTQNSISVEAAHIIFGLGGQNPLGIPASPWLDPAITPSAIRAPDRPLWRRSSSTCRERHSGAWTGCRPTPSATR
jgi:hypothetical protein